MTEKTLANIKYNSDRHLPKISERPGVPLLFFPELEIPGVCRNAFTTRLGGVSTGCWSSMNLGLTRGDDPEAVSENFRRVAATMDIPVESITMTYQKHTSNVRKITAEDVGKGYSKKREYDDIDALVSNVPGVCLGGYVADCVPVVFVDPVKRAVGFAHSGWRGTVGRITQRIVSMMADEFGTDPKDVIAGIGPSIGSCCYEVDDPVIEKINACFKKEYQGEIYHAKGGGKYQLDLQRAVTVTLLETGLMHENIHVTDICTCCNPELFFSHRAVGEKRGNMCAFIYLEK